MSVRKREWTTAMGESRTAWIVDYADVRGKRRQKSFGRKKDADAYAATARLEVREGTHVADSTSATIRQAGELWVSAIERAGRERSTVEQYRGHLDHHLIPMVGNVRLTTFGVPDARKLEEDLLDAGRSTAMTRKVWCR